MGEMMKIGTYFALASIFVTGLLTVSASPQVVINELMYAPYEPFGTTNNTEYIELYHAGASPVDLDAYRFDNGVAFEFPPGTRLLPDTYLVVCEDVSAFTNAYPLVTNVVGNFKGSLNNGGERLTLSRLESNTWITVDTIRYIDGGPSDGGGTSLELVHPGFARLENHYAGAWLDSTAPSGTPGVVNAVYDPNPPPVAGDVIHEPALPFPGSIVTIRARVAGFAGDALPVVQLDYRKDAWPQVEWSRADMFDDGMNGDEVAGDGVYAVQIPGSGDFPMQDGELLEFRVTLQDHNGRTRTVPAVNRSGVLSGPYSYLCYFGEDTDFTGEYSTYHILLTEEHRTGPAGLERRGDASSVLLDSTFITSGGRVIYNCGVRYRGRGSRRNPYSFRVEFPRGETWKGYQDINFLHNEPLLQHIGMRTMEKSGGGNLAPATKLCRIWLNDTLKSDLVNDQGQGGVYVRMEKIGHDFIAKHYPDDTGNIYRGEVNGDLDYRTQLADYQNGTYRVETNNPFTVWHSLSNLCWVLNQDASRLPDLLADRVNLDQWARHYGVQVALENGEGGLVAARLTRGDDYYMYADPADGQFDLLPWDFDSILDDDLPEVGITRSIWAFESNDGGAQPVVSNFLLNPPMVSRYAGHVLDVLDHPLNSASMDELFDDMGSALTPSYRAKLQDHMAIRRASILGTINTQLTASVVGALAEGPLVSVVTHASVSLTGSGPQAWTTRILVGGEEATWDTRSGLWSTTNPITLPARWNEVLIEAYDHRGRLLQSATRHVLVQTHTAERGGVVDVDTRWDAPGGVVHVVSDVTVTSSARLSVAPGTIVTLDPGVRIQLVDGILDIQGDEATPVHIYPADGASAWSLEARGSTASITGSFASMHGGMVAAADGGALTLDHCELSGYPGPEAIVSADHAGLVTLRHCRIADYAAVTVDATPALVEDCLFEHMSKAGIHFVGSTATVARTTIRYSTSPWPVDGVQLVGGSVGTLTGCMLHNLSGKGVATDNEQAGPSVPVEVLPAGSNWTYLDDGSDQGSAWTAPGFDDSAWSSGPAQLGYGDGDETTEVGFGQSSGSKYPTTYFRSSFVVSNSWDVLGLTMHLLRDDGAIVYLNGTEVVRQNMPAGEVNHLSWASAVVGGADENRFFTEITDGSLVVPGTNQLAVEIHQIHGESSDVSFDLAVTAEVVEETEGGGGRNVVTVEHSLIHHCQTGLYCSETSTLSNDHNTITACETGLRGSSSLLPELLVRDSYLPGVPVLVRVDMRDDLGRMGRDLWDAVAVLAVSDEEVLLSTNRVPLYNGRGSALVTFSGGGNFVLTATVDGKGVSKAMLSLDGAPVEAVSGALPGASTTWSGLVHVTGDLLVPSGHTLTIEPGTLVLLDGVPAGSDGTDIEVAGSVQCLGTEARPVTFTASDPTYAWGELHHNRAASSVYRYAMITRGGHAPGGGHTGSGPVVRLSNAGVTFDGSCITDLEGKVMYSTAVSDVTFRNCHLARAVMGPEIQGTAALLEETWITEMFGPNDNDGLYLHDQQPGQEITLRNGVNADCDDDALDLLRATVDVEDYILRDAFDKGMSVYGGEVHIRGAVIVDNGTGISLKEEDGGTGRVSLDHATIVGNDIGIQVRDKFGAPDAFLTYFITNSIIEPFGADPIQTDYDPTNIHVRYSNVGEVWPGAGNFNADPQWVDAASHDFHLRDDSPCIDAGDPGRSPDADGSVTEMGYYPFDAGSDGISTNRNTIVWGNDHDVVGDAVFTWSDVWLEGIQAWPGEENINRNPWFRDPEECDFRLQPISPAIGSASDATDRGASFPSGASPVAPSNLELSNIMEGDNHLVALQWQDHSPDESSFELERSLDGTTWEWVASFPADTTNGVDTALAQNTSYHYRVRAIHHRGESLYTDAASILTGIGTTLASLIEDLRLTEIMYHPADSTDDAHEFLELKNTGSAPLDLSGLRFSNGIDFTFADDTTLAAGAFFVMIRDPVAFAERYPSQAWHGVFENGTGLRNSGERLTLQDATGNQILSVAYDDGADVDWYPTTDGDGYALVLNDFEADLDRASSWRAGSYVGGSPGQDDPPAPYGTVVISEVLTHTDDPLEDAIELFNAGSAGVDIAGWYLSDDADNVKKYPIPGGSLVIPPGGRHVLYAGTSFAQHPGDPGSFAISELGEQVFLSSAEGTTLTSYRTWVKFGAADNGVSFGRHTRSDGEVDFVAMSNRTFGVDQPLTVAAFRTGAGLPNAYPRVGPVVINEIMYNPSATGKEFIELYNISGASVPMFDPAFPTNHWTLDGAVEFAFPANTWLAAGERVVLVGVEPDVFRMQYGLTNGDVRIFGPYDGDLANGGESVKLYRPGQPEPDGFVPRVRMDRVKYDDDAPWPEAADNEGPSLERIEPHLYGNEPTNWAACTLGGTPGEANNAACLPSVGFARTRDSGLESNGVAQVALTLFPPVSDTVTVHYVVGGTATAGADYSLAGGTAIFWPHDHNVVLSLALHDDLAAEPDEQVVITLTSVSANARLGGSDTYTYTLVDTDHSSVPAPVIAPAGTNLFEGSILVAMTSTLSQARIFYTLDGSLPTDEDPLYTGPVLLPHSARVRARTYLGEVNASAPAEALFLEQLSLGPPLLSNYPGAGSIGRTSAMLNGSVISTGQAPTTVSVYWGAVDGGDATSLWEHVHHFGVRPPGPAALSIDGLVPDQTHYYRFHGVNEWGDHWASPSASFVTLSGRPAVENTCGVGGVSVPFSTTHVSRGSVWRYLDDGSDQGSNWSDPGFDDSGWARGPAKLGFGDNNEATTVRFGPDADSKFTTTYFRHAFHVPSIAGITGTTVRLLRDDGAVVYLNGSEMVRDNLPDGAIAFDTFADDVVGGSDEDTHFEFALAGNLLVAGTNTVAVELHQVNLGSSDLGFDLELASHGVRVHDGSVSDLTPQSARIAGTLLSAGDAPSTVLVRWGRADGGADPGAWENAQDLGIQNEGEHALLLEGLVSGATYFYRFAASNVYGLTMADCSAMFTTPNQTSGDISADTVWLAAHSPYTVTGDVTILPGATLTIEPGVEVRFDPGTGMTIRGRLVAEGTTSDPITFTRSTPGSSWERLMFVEAEDSVLRHCLVEFSNCEGDHKDYYDDDCDLGTPPPSRTYFQAVVIIACHVDIESCVFQHLPDSTGSREGDAVAVISDDPDVPGEATATIRDCRFLSIGQGIHTRHAYVLVEHCYFTDHHGDNDDIDLFGESIPPSLIRYNRMISPAHDDMINPTRCSAILVGNEVANGDDHGIVLRDRCRPVLINNLVYNCASAGIAVQNQCDAFLFNNLILNSSRGVRFFDHDTRWGAPYCLHPGSGRATMANNTIWDCPTPLLLADSPYAGDPGSHVSIMHCVVWGGQASASVSANSTLTWGPGNSSADPLFANPGEGDFRVLPGSPCIDTGTNVTAAFSVTNHLGETAEIVVTVTSDYDQWGRPLDGDGDGHAVMDIGPYEYLRPASDSNGDGVPDGWYADYGLNPADPDVGGKHADMDRVDNRSEFITDTNPTNAMSYLRVLRMDPSPSAAQDEIHFGPSSSARVYTLQVADDAINGNWTNEAGQVNIPGNGLSQDMLPGAGPPRDRRYYRIEVRVP